MLKQKCIRLVREKLTIFPCGQFTPTESLLNAVLKMYFVTRSTLAFTRNLQKCNSDYDVSATKNAAQQQMAAAKSNAGATENT